MREKETEGVLLVLVYLAFLLTVLWMTVHAIPAALAPMTAQEFRLEAMLHETDAAVAFNGLSRKTSP